MQALSGLVLKQTLLIFVLLPFFLIHKVPPKMSSNNTWPIMILQSFVGKQHLPHGMAQNTPSICTMHNPAMVYTVHSTIHGLHVQSMIHYTIQGSPRIKCLALLTAHLY